MGDCQIVLRYFALKDPNYIKGSMRAILDSCMERNKKASERELNNFEIQFNGALKLAYDLFDGKPFRIKFNSKREIMSLGLYDAVMIALDRNWPMRKKLLEKKRVIQDKLATALMDTHSYEKIVGRTNTASAISQRIGIVDELLVSVI